MKRRVVSAILSTFVTSATALSPLTPRLESSTHAELLAGLAQAELPAVAHNSVVLAITQALGFEAADGDIQYEATDAHLPQVKGRVTRVSDRCSRVEARAWLLSKEADAVVIEGIYCLVGAAEWASHKQLVSRSATRG